MDSLEVRFEWISEAGGWNYFVNGMDLLNLVAPNRNMTSGLHYFDASGRDVYLYKLLGEAVDLVRSGRTRLFVCAECGDFACGAITMSVQRNGNVVEWSDFTDEANYDEYPTRKVAPGLRFTFDVDELEMALRKPFE